jgi:hypothetical protein
LWFLSFATLLNQYCWILLDLAAMYMIVGLKWSGTTKSTSGEIT